jgi:hypothetical protein
MTPQADVLPDLVEEMLLDARLGQDDGLRSALLSLASLASLPAPVPSGELAAMLAEDGAGPAGDELGRRRWLSAQRPTVVGLALIAGMGMGVGGVAASSIPPGQAGSPSIQHMLKDWAPAWSLPTPQAVGPVPAPAAAGNRNAVGPHAPEQDALQTDGQATAAPDTVKPSVPRRSLGSAAVQAAPSAGAKGTVRAPLGTGESGVKGPATDDAGAAATDKGGRATRPGDAVGQGGSIGSDAPGQVAGTVQGAVAAAVDETLHATADTADAALTAVPGNSWLQKFKW